MGAGGPGPDMRAGGRWPDNPNTLILHIFQRNLKGYMFFDYNDEI